MNALFVLALLSTVFPVAQTRGTLALADRTEVRGGNFGFASDPALHLETVPSATLTVAGRATTLMLQYAPHIGLTDIQLGLDPYYLNSGTANLGHRWRTYQLALEESASYGTLNLSGPLLPAAGTIASNSLLNGQVLYEATTTSLISTLTVRRWQWRTTLSFSVSGGADDVSRRNSLPLLITPRAETILDYTATRRTHLITTLSAQHDSVSPPDQDYTILEANQGLSHRLSRRTELLLAGGASWVDALVAIPPLVDVSPNGIVLAVGSSSHPAQYVPNAIRRSRTLYPVAQAALVMQAPYRDRFDVRLQARLAPSINRTTGRLSQQVSALAGVHAAWHPWQLGADANFAQSLDESGVNYLSYYALQAAVGYEATRQVTFELGTQLGWQKIGVNASPTTVELAFVAVTLRPTTLRF